jgi:hypothetical protein
MLINMTRGQQATTVSSGRLVGATSCFSFRQKLLALESGGNIIIILAHFIPSSSDTLPPFLFHFAVFMQHSFGHMVDMT